MTPHPSRPGTLTRAATRSLPALVLALTLTACPDPPHGDLVVDNRSDEPIYVYQVRSDTEDPLMAGPVEPGEDTVFFVLPRGRACAQASVFAIRDADGHDLALRDMRTDPVCDGDPWTGPAPPTTTATPDRPPGSMTVVESWLQNGHG